MRAPPDCSFMACDLAFMRERSTSIKRELRSPEGENYFESTLEGRPPSSGVTASVSASVNQIDPSRRDTVSKVPFRREHTTALFLCARTRLRFRSLSSSVRPDHSLSDDAVSWLLFPGGAHRLTIDLLPPQIYLRDLLRVRDVVERVGIQNHEVGALARFQRPVPGQAKVAGCSDRGGS
jgi:hypothetical protein